MKITVILERQASMNVDLKESSAIEAFDEITDIFLKHIDEAANNESTHKNGRHD
ncbi:hypothetical protein [Clostridium sp. DMHC 10]|uniref:hypothetical protein n=1 Tax=Clostridium sp. DMHC 10 TaxID=747377 RepID=UPI000AF80ADB|nr:hypothetical protein [Clostridium sp. DMHC 10]